MLLLWMAGCEPAADSAGDLPVAMLESVDLEAPSDGDDPTPERANTASAEGDDYDIGYLRGWVKASVDEVFGALSDPEVGVDRREMSAWSVEELSDPDLDATYLVTNTVAGFPVDFEVTWKHVYTATGDTDDGVLSAWEKTGGTDFVPMLAGSAEATQAEGAFDLKVVYHLGTIDSTPEDAVRYLEDFYASVLAAAHGQPLPTYE